jgi:thiamine pyrophosphate-dependent acetolactate synthase large subunit-like protein
MADATTTTTPWLYGTDWSQLPWANFIQSDANLASQMQGWFNTFYPWLEAYQQGEQWGQEFDWSKAMDEWTQQFQEGQFDWQKTSDLWSQQFQEAIQNWTHQQDVWARGLQESQLAESARATNMNTFGRRWTPTTRWS